MLQNPCCCCMAMPADVLVHKSWLRGFASGYHLKRPRPQLVTTAHHSSDVTSSASPSWGSDACQLKPSMTVAVAPCVPTAWSRNLVTT